MEGTTIAHAIVFYLAILSILFIGIVCWMVLMKWKNDWQTQLWESRKQSFRQKVEEYLITSSSVLSPRMKSSLQGDFREWALTELMHYEERLSGQSGQRLTQLLYDWGFVEELDRWLASPKWWKRLKALQVVAVFHLTDKKQEVIRSLKDSHPLIRMKAFWGLGMIGDRQDLPILLDALKRDHYDWFQVDRVVTILNQLDFSETSNTGNWLVSFYHEASKPFVKRCLIDLMAEQGSYEVIPFLNEEVLTQELPFEVRIGMLKTLLRLHAVQAIPTFRSILANENDHPGVLIMAMKGVALLGGASCKQVFVEYLGHPLWWVRYYSAVGLARMGDVGELKRISVEHPDLYGREMARYFLQLIQQEGALWRSIESSLIAG